MTAHPAPLRSGIPSELTGLHPDRWTMPFWQAATEHRLVAPRCVGCSAFHLPPAPLCPHCQGRDLEWIELSGHGRVYTFTVARQALIPALADAVPYVIALVDLDDAPGVRLVLALIGCAPEDVEVDAPVEIIWEDYSNRAIPRAQLAAHPAGKVR